MGITANNVAPVNTTNSSNEARYGGPGRVPPKTTQANKNAADVASAVPAATPPSTDRILINELEGANDEIRTVARQIREVDNTMDLIGQNLEKMTASLDVIVKSYPPYLQNDKARITALRQFGGLRQLIDQLTFPPPDDSPAKILGDKKLFPLTGDWQLPIGKGTTPVIIRRQPVHAGADGLDLPELASDASDELVHKALGQLTKSHEALRQKRLGFAEDANRAIAAMF